MTRKLSRMRLLPGAVLATVLTAAATLTAAPLTASAGTTAGDLASTIALSNCSASLVRFPTSLGTDRAMMLTNGHCYEGGMPSAGEVVTNRGSTRSGTMLNAGGGSLGTVRADLVMYATMTGTDVTLYRLNETFDALKTRLGSSAVPLTISANHPADGTSMYIPSSYWKQVWSCSVSGFVYELREASWTFKDSIRYDANCDTTHGTSGSPIVNSTTREIIGINNTGNDDGQQCTLNNPCEVDQNGNITVHQGQSYGQQTYLFNTCLSSTNTIDLTKSGCLLAGATNPTPTPTPTPTPVPTPTPTPTGTGGVAGETGAPRVTLPPTDALSGSTQAPSGESWRLVLLAMAGILAGALLLTPSGARRRNR